MGLWDLRLSGSADLTVQIPEEKSEWTESRESVQQSNKSLKKAFLTECLNVCVQQQQVHADIILPRMTSAY